MDSAQAFIKKLQFMYVETPPELDPDYNLLIIDSKNDEMKKTPEMKEKFNDQITEAFGGYGQKVLDWIFDQEPHIISSIMNDLAIMKTLNNSKYVNDKKQLMGALTPSMRVYGFAK
jgi:hypothetical protein